MQNPIDEALKRAYLTITRLSEIAGVSESELLSILHGRQLNINQNTLGNLSRALDVSPEKIQDDYEAWMYSQ